MNDFIHCAKDNEEFTINYINQLPGEVGRLFRKVNDFIVVAKVNQAVARAVFHANPNAVLLMFTLDSKRRLNLLGTIDPQLTNRVRQAMIATLARQPVSQSEESAPATPDVADQLMHEFERSLQAPDEIDALVAGFRMM